MKALFGWLAVNAEAAETQRTTKKLSLRAVARQSLLVRVIIVDCRATARNDE